MVVFGIILVAVVFFVVFKVLISEAKPYKKHLNTENAVEEKKVLDNKKKAEPQKVKPATKKTKKSKFEYKTYRVPGGYGYLLGGVGGGGRAGSHSSVDDEFDEAEYRAYR
jgi:mannitol-specific phosphotransferase system IIBC component